MIGGTTARVAANVSIRASEQPEAAAATYRERCGLTAWSGHQAVMSCPLRGRGEVTVPTTAHDKQQSCLEALARGAGQDSAQRPPWLTAGAGKDCVRATRAVAQALDEHRKHRARHATRLSAAPMPCGRVGRCGGAAACALGGGSTPPRGMAPTEAYGRLDQGDLAERWVHAVRGMAKAR